MAHDGTKFKQLVKYEFLRAGGRESAVDFTIGNAEKVFKMKDGKPTTDIFSVKNPGVPLTVDEWIAQQIPIHDYAFLPSRGGGARPSPNGPPAGKTVIPNDPRTLGLNLEAIARGDVTIG